VSYSYSPCAACSSVCVSEAGNTATHCNTLQHATTHMSYFLFAVCCLLLGTCGCEGTLQRAATHCNTLQHTAAHFNTPVVFLIAVCCTVCVNGRGSTATHCSTLQHTATHCSTLQHIAAHCNTLQHTATHCNTQVVFLIAVRCL